MDKASTDRGSHFLVIIGSCFASLVLFLVGDLAYSAVLSHLPNADPATRSADFDHTFVPDFSGHRKWGPVRYYFATNNLGFADRSPRAVPLKGSKYRIMFLGDSFTEGVGVPFDKTFVGLSAAALKKRDIEVLNAAVASYSPRLYYAKLKYYLDRGLKIDELFVFIDISDVQDEAVWQRDGFCWGADPDAVDPYTIRVRKVVPPPPPPKTLGNWAITGMRLTSTAWGLFKEWRTGRLGKKQEVGLDPRGSWTFDAKLFDAWGREGLDTCGLYMQKVADLCRRSHVKLRIAVYPWREQILTNDLDSIQVEYWRRFCKENGVPFLNYFPEFVDRGDKDQIIQDYFIAGDIHWNRKGHQKIEDKLAKAWDTRY